jgi:hypothetical protein
VNLRGIWDVLAHVRRDCILGEGRRRWCVIPLACTHPYGAEFGSELEFEVSLCRGERG